MLGSKIRFEGLRGVGTVELDLQENQRVYTLIGPNGVGKTKTLEGLFQILLFTHNAIRNKELISRSIGAISKSIFSFSSTSVDGTQYTLPESPVFIDEFWNDFLHETPFIFIPAQNRGFINTDSQGKKFIGSWLQRQASYFELLIKAVREKTPCLVMDSDIELWFTSIAQSANPYQKQEDNREVEIKTVLKLLHEIDEKIDPQFLEISGDGRVSLKIDGQKRELSHLSTGFASILKMLQAIVSGYGYFTNEVQLQNVPGIVLIDEIESHLHLSWQSHIIPLFKRLFPNTTFYITTHSPIVLTQLNEGEAYRLERDADGVVRTHLIHAPNRAAMVDVLQEAFDVDLNRIKQDSSSPESRKAAKQQLLNLLKTQWGDA